MVGFIFETSPIGYRFWDISVIKNVEIFLVDLNHWYVYAVHLGLFYVSSELKENCATVLAQQQVYANKAASQQGLLM